MKSFMYALVKNIIYFSQKLLTCTSNLVKGIGGVNDFIKSYLTEFKFFIRFSMGKFYIIKLIISLIT